MTDVTRRQFLTATASVATVGALAGESPRPVAAATPAATGTPDPTALDHVEAVDVRDVAQRFEATSGERVDGVSDLGLDTTAQASVTGRVERAARQGQVVELPPGDYLFDRPVRTGASGWGLVGTGSAPTEVRLHTAGNGQIIDQRGGRNVRFANVAMVNGQNGQVGQQLYDGRGPPRGAGCAFTVEGGLDIRNVHHIGVSPREGVSGDHEEFNHQTGSFTVNITDPNGVGVIDGFVKTSPTEISGHAENDAALNSWAAHQGVCYVRNSTLWNGGGDGITYLSRTPGGWRFTNCSFQSFTASALRLGGGQSWARRCTILMDSALTRQRNNVLSGIDAGCNGIVWESSSGMTPAGRNRAGGLVDGCRIIMRASIEESQGGIVVDGSAGGVVIRNTVIENHSQWDSIAVDRPGSSFMNNNEVPNGPHPVYLENVQLTGSGSGPAVDAARRAVTRNVTVAMPNGPGLTGSVDAAGGGGGLPGFAQELLALQGGVPSPAQAIGAAGVAIGGAVVGAAAAVGSVIAGVVLLVFLLVAVVPLALGYYLLD